MTNDALPLVILLIFMVAVTILMSRINATVDRINSQYEEAMGYED